MCWTNVLVAAIVPQASIERYTRLIFSLFRGIYMLTYGAVSQMQRTKSTELTEDQRQPDSENRFSGSENRFWFREPNAPELTEDQRQPVSRSPRVGLEYIRGHSKRLAFTFQLQLFSGTSVGLSGVLYQLPTVTNGFRTSFS